MKNKILLLGILLVTIFSNCKKDTLEIFTTDDFEKGATLKESYLLVQVVNENDAPLSNAKIVIGNGQVFTTDQYGTVQLSKVGIKTTGHLFSITKAGYFNSFKRVYPEAGVLKVVLVKKNSLDLSASAGGNLSFAGIKLEFPANSIVDSKGNPFNFNVNVSAKHIDPTADNFGQLAPGDLRAIRLNGQAQLLASFGMIAVEMNDDFGNKLQIAPNKTVKIKMDLNGKLASTSPGSIPTWSFDEVTGVWKEEGVATKIGNTYEFEASHFSFWNCDVPNDYINFKTRIVDTNGDPVSGLTVSLQAASGAGTGYGTSGANGIVEGKVPANTEFDMTVFKYCPTGSVIFKTQKIGPFSSDTDFGDIVINNTSNTSVFGTLKDCNGNNVTNGYVKLFQDSIQVFVPVINGIFSMVLPCNYSGDFQMIAFDNINIKESLVSGVNLIANQANDLGSVVACYDLDEYILLTVDGQTFLYTENLVMFADSLNIPPFTGYVIQSSGGINGYAALGITSDVNMNLPMNNFLIEGAAIPGGGFLDCVLCLQFTNTYFKNQLTGTTEGTFSGVVPGTIAVVSGSYKIKN